MIPKYVTQFSVTDLDEGRPVPLEQLQNHVCNWVGSLVGCPGWHLEQDPTNKFADGSRFESAHEVVDGIEHWAACFTRPDPKVQVEWVTEIGVAHTEQASIVSLGLAVATPAQRRIAILNRVRPPRLVRTIVSTYDAFTDARLVLNAMTVDVNDVEEFVRWVGSPTRILPIIVVSVDPHSEKPLIAPDDLQRYTIGLAHVVVVTKRAALELTSLLSQILGGRQVARRWTIHSGAIRVYWPSLDVRDPEASPFQHRMWLPDEDGRLPSDTDTEIFAELAWAAVHRVRGAWVDIRNIRTRADAEQRDILRNKLAQNNELQRTFDEILDRQRDDLDNAQSIAQESRDKERAANDQLEAARQQMRELAEQRDAARHRVRELERGSKEGYHLAIWGAPDRDIVEGAIKSESEKAEVYQALDRLRESSFWTGSKDMECLGEGLWECRVNVKDHWYRFFVARFTRLDSVVVLHGLAKKTNALTQSDIKLARERLKSSCSPA